ncbi:MAG TPA: glycerate dehydrogenase [Verrucomicrobiales bacterium]|nr:glycerate dehydrogenase [Verrucomicrobiales bacterium]
MNIVVLDGHTLNPGDLSWAELQALGSCEIHERTRPDQLHARAKYAEILLTNKVPLRSEQFAELPKLKYVGVTATGYNIVDVAAASARGIVVTNAPAYGTQSVAQMTFALLLELTQNVGLHSRRVREGAWTSSPDWCFWDRLLIELEGLTLGIVGFGRIGQAVARLGTAFGMRVQVATRTTPTDLPEGIHAVGIDELFRSSDVVTLHCPLTPETNKLVNVERLALMKPTAFLINTSRGQLVDETALAEALDQRRLAGAALDVLSVEPPGNGNPLLAAANCLLTPHIAWATRAARERLMRISVRNVSTFLSGRPENVVS